ncbi:kinase [Paenibacillus baekrokdamisoli]|uniref:Kinase n=1 Tax=Paenibacillus baekrokdamisoli TaxID=1712516 RepID=A0A3G9JIT3_9BACL|nr:BadF/BadG/BcrA/BcrD ATPase family protein [Paenibacillus baekrokdamisoli]MBB3068072.1 N-acetylglucosamine kinase-like BadF-type ATPase [Paenibacillus baekrokdamisoli]BBH22884.1 kinase [Paenibacillus baekrokdamisoli]
MTYYLGIDGGGSKTHALVTDEHGNVLGKGKSGNGNHQIDAALAASNLTAAALEALTQANLHQGDISHAYFGLAGADREVDYRILHPIIQAMGFEQYTINCDTMIGLRAGTTLPYGIAVICGTGTNCTGRNPSGEYYQCGGFSYMYGDFGGGGALNIEVFRSVIRAWDGREEPTLLTPLLLRLLGYSTVELMYNDYLDHERQVPLEVVKLLFEAAEAGDRVALDILHKQGVELSKSVVAVTRKLGLGDTEFDVVLAGSLLTKGDKGWIRSPIEEALRQAAPLASLVTLKNDPVIGAVWSAMEADGLTVSTAVSDRMQALEAFDHILI